MMKRRGWQVLIVVGGILAVAGLYGVVTSFMVRHTGTSPIPAGWQSYLREEFNVLGAGVLRIDYAATHGTVDVFVFTEAQHADYVNWGFAEALFAVGDSVAGSFDVSLPESGK
jgi:hypothetical protein